MYITPGVPLVYDGKKIGVSIKANDFGEFILFSENIPFNGESREGCLWAELPYFDFTEESKKAFCAQWVKISHVSKTDSVTCDTPYNDKEAIKALTALFPENTKLDFIDSYAFTMECLEEQKQNTIEDGIWEEFLP